MRVLRSNGQKFKTRLAATIFIALAGPACTKANFTGIPLVAHENSIKLISNSLSYVGSINTPLNIPKSDIMAAISMPAGDTLKALSIRPPQLGQVGEDGDHFVFQTSTPGTIVLQYDASDKNNLSTSNSISIKVLPGTATAAYYACGDGKLYELSVDNQSILNTVSTTYLGKVIEFNDLAINVNGELYAKDHDHSGIYKVDAKTGVSTQIVATVPGSTDYLLGLTFMPNGNLATVQLDGTIFSFNLATLKSTVLKQTNYRMQGGDFKELHDGYAYWTVSNASSNTCRNYGTIDSQTLVKYDPISGVAVEVGCLDQPMIYGLGFAYGNVYGFTGTGSVVQINTSTAKTTVLATPGFKFIGAASNPALW